ncbi:kinase-like protein [Auricularia subglabra TFB-10046 SS5]|nr:kinase-like protein [Auricularia subglabra TFB-10046 SS5]
MAAQALQIAESAGNLAPGLGVLVSIVDVIYSTTKAVGRHRQQCQTLADFCRSIVEVLDQNVKEVEAMPDGQAKEQLVTRTTVGVKRLQQTLEETRAEVIRISQYSVLDSVLKQDKIKQTITDRRVALTDCVTLFSITSQLGLARWNADFQTAAERDHSMLMDAVSAAQRSQAVAEQPPAPATLPRANSALHAGGLEDSLRMLQLSMRMYEPGSTQHSALQTTLRDLQRHAGGPLLPLADLVGEAQKIKDAPVHYSATAEIWQGIWLGDTTMLVALKCLRAQTPPQSSAVRRFHRQIEIVRRVQHPNIIKLFGVCYVDGPSTYLVFPWMKHGDIIAYLKTHPHADRLRLMIDVARGLAHLHSQDPPMVHSALQPSNILVDDNHRAIVADFGLAKALESLGGETNYTLSNGAQVSMRWMAPELSDSRYGTPADVYAWSMTALQVLSGFQPFYLIKQPGRVVISVHQGVRPLRKDYPAESFTDESWGLLEDCWKHDSAGRPKMAEVVQRIEAMRPDLVGV